MKKGTVVECIKTVVMNDGVVTFIKGDRYKTYPHTFQSGWEDVRKVTCAKNANGDRHIILEESREESILFFNTHFKVIFK